MSFIMFTTRFAIFLSIMYYINDGRITAEKVFVMFGYYQILRQTMTVYFPQGVAMVIITYVTKLINFLGTFPIGIYSLA